MYQFDRKEYEKRMEWYQDARFGMFIHWGLYSIPARGEWVRSVEEIPEEEYLPFMKEFDARDYNPKQWRAMGTNLCEIRHERSDPDSQTSRRILPL